jgi:UDPglucose 6-dehydrogenase
VLAACQLERDVADMPAGDETIVGNKGLTLSGGQRARAGLARAVYSDADVVLHLTEWREYRDLDPHQAAKLARTPLIIDGRNTLDPKAWRGAGWTYRALGRPGA